MTGEPLDDKALRQVFTQARTFNAWLDKPVSDAQLKAISDLMKMGPTSANCLPARIVFVKSAEAKARLKPFLGGGISYTKIFDTEDASVQNLEADDAFGPVLRVGFDYMVDDRNGFFLSANKIFTSTTVNGTAAVLGGAPVSADIDLDPLIIHAGWTHRF